MIIGRDLLTDMGLDPKFSKHFIIVSDGPCKVWSATMVDATDYDFKYSENKIIKTEEPFINSYVRK